MSVQERLRPTRVLRSFEKLQFFVWKPYCISYMGVNDIQAVHVAVNIIATLFSM